MLGIFVEITFSCVFCRLNNLALHNVLHIAMQKKEKKKKNVFLMSWITLSDKFIVSSTQIVALSILTGFQYLVEEVAKILARVDAALCTLQLAKTVLEEENGKFDEEVERGLREEKLADLKRFELSKTDGTTHLKSAFECFERISK